MSLQSRDEPLNMERHIYFYQARLSWSPSKFCLTSDVMSLDLNANTRGRRSLRSDALTGGLSTSALLSELEDYNLV